MDWVDLAIEDAFPDYLDAVIIKELTWVRRKIRKLINEVLIKVLSQGMQAQPTSVEEISKWKEEAQYVKDAFNRKVFGYVTDPRLGDIGTWSARCLDLIQVIENLLRKVAALMNDSDAYQLGYSRGLSENKGSDK